MRPPSSGSLGLGETRLAGLENSSQGHPCYIQHENQTPGRQLRLVLGGAFSQTRKIKIPLVGSKNGFSSPSPLGPPRGTEANFFNANVIRGVGRGHP